MPTKISTTNITHSTANKFHKARSLVGSEFSKNLSRIVTIIDASIIDPKAPKCLKNFLLLSEIRKQFHLKTFGNTNLVLTTYLRFSLIKLVP